MILSEHTSKFAFIDILYLLIERSVFWRESQDDEMKKVLAFLWDQIP